jgi:hypothetical protein
MATFSHKGRREEAILPDGQITFARRILSSPFAKNIPLCF